MNNIAAKLEELADLRATADATRIDYEKKRTEILKAVQTELDALDAEYQPLLESAQTRADALETEIKDAVVHHGASVKGTRLYAMFFRGRVSWDREKLETYGKTHPEVMNFRKEGEPYVSLRATKT